MKKRKEYASWDELWSEVKHIDDKLSAAEFLNCQIAVLNKFADGLAEQIGEGLSWSKSSYDVVARMSQDVSSMKTEVFWGLLKADMRLTPLQRGVLRWKHFEGYSGITLLEKLDNEEERIFEGTSNAKACAIIRKAESIILDKVASILFK